jgi:uncharacterized protein
MSTVTKRALLALLMSGLCLPVLRVRADPAGRRQHFVYLLRVTPAFHEERDWTEKQLAVVGRHFERLARSRQVILAGRTTEALANTFGIVIFVANDAEAARQFMEDDPAVIAGLMSATLHPCTVALGSDAGLVCGMTAS